LLYGACRKLATDGLVINLGTASIRLDGCRFASPIKRRGKFLELAALKAKISGGQLTHLPPFF